MASISLFIVHPTPVVRIGIEALLKGSSIRVVGHASGGKEAVACVIKHQPDVVIVADQFQQEDAFDQVKKIRQAVPSAKVLMLGDLPDPTLMARAAAAGVADFISDIQSAKDFKEAIIAAANAPAPTGSNRYGEIVSSLKSLPPNPLIDLTPREQQVLRHIAYGLSNEEISESMKISIETVKEFVSGILRKLRVKDRTQAAVWAVRKGFV